MKTIKNKIILGLLCAHVLLSTSALNAAEKEKDNDRFPIGCNDVGYKKSLRVLTILPSDDGNRNSMYFVYNRLPETVNLYHMHEGNSNSSVYLNNAIRADSWSVFATNEKEVKFICSLKDKKLDYGKIIDCGKALSVCEYTKVKFGLNNRGNLWIVSSNTKNGAVRGVVRYGIIPAY